MNRVQDILSFKRDPREDFYATLGCDRTSTDEQILAEYRVRAREVHPDKRAAGASKEEAAKAAEEFQALQEVKMIVFVIGQVKGSYLMLMQLQCYNYCICEGLG